MSKKVLAMRAAHFSGKAKSVGGKAPWLIANRPERLREALFASPPSLFALAERHTGLSGRTFCFIGQTREDAAGVKTGGGLKAEQALSPCAALPELLASLLLQIRLLERRMAIAVAFCPHRPVGSA